VKDLETRMASTAPTANVQLALMKQVVRKGWADGMDVLQF